MTKRLYWFAGLAVAATLICVDSYGQKRKPAATPPPSVSPIEKNISGLKKFPGFFEFYFDEKLDRMLLLIDKPNVEFLYIESLTAAIGSNDIGLDRNQLGSQRIVKFERKGPSVWLTEPNINYRASTTNDAERKAVEESFATSVLEGFKVVAEDPDGKVLIDATDFFIQDVHNVAGRLRSAGEGSYSLDKSRSAFFPERIRNFPMNSEWEVTLTFSGQSTGKYLPSVVPTSSSVTVREHFSFVQLPYNNFKPRRFDPRAGYFNTSWYDYATPISELLEQRFITRHRLEKKDPSAAMSDPVKPIIYYVDPGAPEPVRQALIDGAGWWNQAFEAAGYRNAFRVEVLPEGADPMDVRYNVINWVHRATRGWSYGSEIIDPRTGEVIKGHVTLGSLRARQDFLIAEGLLAPYEDGKPVSDQMQIMTLARLRQLAAHEVGHTLGLAHSYSSSTENRASVMDYPHPIVKLTNGKIDLSDAYATGIGTWDKVAIAFGYQDYPDGTDEIKAGDELIQHALKTGLTFLSDQDARPAGGAHPFAHLWDNGKSPEEELTRMLEIRGVILKNFGEKNIRSNTPMATLEEVLVPMYFFHRYQTEATAKLIGGLNYRYAIKGDSQLVTSFIEPARQQKALDALLKTVEPSALMLPENLLELIPPRPMGYDRHREVIAIRTSLTFDALGLAEAAANMTFEILLQPARANRLVEYHARDKGQPALEDILAKVINSTINAKKEKGYAGVIHQTVNNVLIANLFRLAADHEASVITKGIVTRKLSQLHPAGALVSGDDEEWAAHFQQMERMVREFLDSPEKIQIRANEISASGRADWFR